MSEAEHIPDNTEKKEVDKPADLQLTGNVPFDPKIHVYMRRDEMMTLIANHTQYKADIIALVNVFRNISAIIGGGKVMDIIKVVTSLVKSEAKMAELSHIVPIIDKYTENNG